MTAVYRTSVVPGSTYESLCVALKPLSTLSHQKEPQVLCSDASLSLKNPLGNPFFSLELFKLYTLESDG